MRVSERVTFQQYWQDERFARKRPTMRSSLKMAYGDNIYHRGPDGHWQQEDSRHTFSDGTQNQGHVEKDTTADAVLISDYFSYYGGTGPRVPQTLRTDFDQDLIAGRGHRCRFAQAQVQAAVAWLETLERGYRGDPGDW